MERFSFFHISDLHFVDGCGRRSIDDVNDVELSKRIIARYDEFSYVSDIPPRPDGPFDFLAAHRLGHFLADNLEFTDFILVTGDLAETAAKEHLSASRSFFDGVSPWPYALARKFPKLSDLCPIVLVPGNHDRFSPFLRMPGNDEFESAFGSTWAISSPTSVVSNGIRVTRIRKREADLVLCCFDFTLPKNQRNPLRSLGMGMVSEPILDELEIITEREREKPRGAAIIWINHFPPSSPKANRWELLRGAEKLIERAQKCDVPLLMGGHVHNQHHYKPPPTNGAPRVAVSGTATGLGWDNGNRIYSASLEVEFGRLKNVTLTGYLLRGAQFVPDFGPETIPV